MSERSPKQTFDHQPSIEEAEKLRGKRMRKFGAIAVATCVVFGAVGTAYRAYESAQPSDVDINQASAEAYADTLQGIYDGSVRIDTDNLSGADISQVELDGHAQLGILPAYGKDDEASVLARAEPDIAMALESVPKELLDRSGVAEINIAPPEKSNEPFRSVLGSYGHGDFDAIAVHEQQLGESEHSQFLTINTINHELAHAWMEQEGGVETAVPKEFPAHNSDGMEYGKEAQQNGSWRGVTLSEHAAHSKGEDFAKFTEDLFSPLPVQEGQLIEPVVTELDDQMMGGNEIITNKAGVVLEAMPDSLAQEALQRTQLRYDEAKQVERDIAAGKYQGDGSNLRGEPYSVEHTGDKMG